MGYVLHQNNGESLQEAAERIAQSQGRTLAEVRALFLDYRGQGYSIKESAFRALFAPPYGTYPSKKPEFRNRPPRN